MGRPKTFKDGLTYSVFMDKKTGDKVKALAHLKGITFGALIRQALENELKRYNLIVSEPELDKENGM
mgnify:CR=1 FL=1